MHWRTNESAQQFELVADEEVYLTFTFAASDQLLGLTELSFYRTFRELPRWRFVRTDVLAGLYFAIQKRNNFTAETGKV